MAHLYTKVQVHLSHPENRIRYAVDFLNRYVREGDEFMKAKCYDGIAEYSELLDYAEAHY